MRELPLADRSLLEPAPCRLPSDAPCREQALALHAEAVEHGRATYRDPATGYQVLTAAWLARRGTCCGLGCRHCPYV